MRQPYRPDARAVSAQLCVVEQQEENRTEAPGRHERARRSVLARSLAALVAVVCWCGPVSTKANAQQDRLSRTAAAAWTVLHGVAKECPAFPDEQARLNKLDWSGRSISGGSAKQFANALERDPKQKARTDADVQQIINTAGGCDSDALREWQAEARKLIDIYTQSLAAPEESIVVNWPKPALLEPIHVSVEKGGQDVQGREYLKLSLHNPSKASIGVALAGKELRAGLCSDLTSKELPITQQSYRTSKLAQIAPGETLQANLVLSADCFEEMGESALMGTLILETPAGTEYRAIAVLGIRN